MDGGKTLQFTNSVVVIFYVSSENNFQCPLQYTSFHILHKLFELAVRIPQYLSISCNKNLALKTNRP